MAPPYYSEPSASNLSSDAPRSRKSLPGDFELFGQGERNNRTTASGYPNKFQSQEENLGVPDLIPDSPSQPDFEYSPPNPPPFKFTNSSSSLESLRSERSASVPIQTIPKPQRRRTQEFKHQQSFMPTLYGTTGSTQNMLPPFIAENSLLPRTGNSFGSLFAPATDHPLSLAEQQDLLDRVRRDLSGVDLDSIKGPLRAMVLAQPAAIQPKMRTDFYPQPSAQTAEQARNEEMLRKTVSPQEAFLDYDDVDSRLHAGKNSFGQPILLFAPLPQTSMTANSSPKRPAAPSLTANFNSSASSPAVLPSMGQTLVAPRPRQPFITPQNAVSWQENDQKRDDSTGGMLDFERESSDGEDSDDIRRSAVHQMKPMTSSIPGAPVSLDFGDTTSDFDSTRSETPRENTPKIDSNVKLNFHAPKPKIAPSAATETNTTRSNTTSTPDETNSIAESVAVSASSGRMRPSAARALQVLHSDALPLSDNEAEIGDTEDAAGAAADYQPNQTEQKIPSNRRKRSNSPAATHVTHSDDESYHSDQSQTTHAKSRGRGNGPAPNKRRRRIPAAGATKIPAGQSASTTLRCTHTKEDGTICGVVFRRPYDLARHKETIHGEGGKQKVDWICSGCGGSFSRKDALIRHARIRGHKAGV